MMRNIGILWVIATLVALKFYMGSRLLLLPPTRNAAVTWPLFDENCLSLSPQLWFGASEWRERLAKLNSAQAQNISGELVQPLR